MFGSSIVSVPVVWVCAVARLPSSDDAVDVEFAPEADRFEQSRAELP
ncbi:MAG: hypothetical protein ACRDOE_20070 [Streptosporangiaceae bacterium]